MTHSKPQARSGPSQRRRFPTTGSGTAVRTRRRGYSLLELSAVVAILGIVAAVVVTRMTSTTTAAERQACFANQGDIEMQVQLWRREHGSFPSANLGDIGSSIAHFPDGLPLCPIEGTSYTIDAAGHVVGHEH